LFWHLIDVGQRVLGDRDGHDEGEAGEERCVPGAVSRPQASRERYRQNKRCHRNHEHDEKQLCSEADRIRIAYGWRISGIFQIRNHRDGDETAECQQCCSAARPEAADTTIDECEGERE
jgi:hypothetical protein